MKSEPCNEYDITVNIHASTELGELTDPNTNWRRPFRPNSSLLTLLLEMPSERHVTIVPGKLLLFDAWKSYRL